MTEQPTERRTGKFRFLKDERMWRDVRRFYVFLRPHRGRALLAILFTMAVGAAGAGVAWLLRMFLADVVLQPGGGAGVRSPLLYPALIVGYAVLESGLSFGSEYYTAWVSTRVGNNIKEQLFHKLLRSDPALFDTTSVGDIMIRYSGDADTATAGLLNNARTVITRVMTSVFLIAYIFYLSWILSSITIGSLVVTVIPLSRVRKRLKEFIRISVKSGAEVSTNYIEAYNGNRVVTSYNLYDYAEARLRSSLATIFRIAIKTVQRTNLLSFFMHLATAAGMGAAVWLQGHLIASGHIRVEDFITCVTSMLILYTPIKRIGGNLLSMQSCATAIQRVLEVMDREPAIRSRPGAVTLPGLRRGVKFENVDFAYVPGKPVLRGVTLEVPLGRSVALVGASGGGKTTMVNLLPRFYDVQGGSVAIDGVDVRDIELENLRGLISIVFQENFLFGGTIRDNIVLGRRDASEAEIAAAVRAACLDGFVAELSLGLDTHVGEHGAMLSGGQRQRVAIARAFLKDAPIVILDEATSALDTKSEAVVQRAIENLMANKTVFIIAHRLSTVVNADRIVVMQGGRIAEEGTHGELVSRAGSIYASLYKTQLV